jgi:hypothetical protein
MYEAGEKYVIAGFVFVLLKKYSKLYFSDKARQDDGDNTTYCVNTFVHVRTEQRSHTSTTDQQVTG